MNRRTIPSYCSRSEVGKLQKVCGVFGTALAVALQSFAAPISHAQRADSY